MPQLEVRRLLVVVALFAGLVMPQVAMAQDDTVTIDPGTPAGKQYQLPTDRSRDVAGGVGAADGRADATRDDGGSGGSTTLLVVAVIVVVLVGGGTAFVVRRRA